MVVDPLLPGRLRERAQVLSSADLWSLRRNMRAFEVNGWSDQLEAAQAREAKLTAEIADLLAAASLLEAGARTCETCKYRQSSLNRPLDICGKASIYGHSVAQVACKTLGFGCNAWAPK